MRNKATAQQFFKLLGDTTRLNILLKVIELSASASLTDEPIVAQNTAKHLAEIFGISKSTLAHHVELLKKSAFIKSVKKNHFEYLYADLERFDEIQKFIESEIKPHESGNKFVQAGEIFLKRPIIDTSNMTTKGVPVFDQKYTKQSIQDMFVICGVRSVQSTVDVSGLSKIYFKIPKFIEPFYALLKTNSIAIFCIEKNIESSKSEIGKLVTQIGKYLS